MPQTSRTLVAMALVVAATLLTVGHHRVAQAQRVTLSDGISLPHPSIVDREDAQSLELNPAGLAHLAGWELQYLQGSYSDDLGTGYGVVMAFPIVDGLGVGYGFQWIDGLEGLADDDAVEGLTLEPYRKHTLGFGLGGDLAIGLNYNFFGSEDSQVIDELSAWDLGLQWRLFHWLAFGALIRDVDTPFVGEAVIDPSVVLGGTLRFFQGRLSLESDVAFFAPFDETGRYRPRFLAAIEPIDGVRLFGSVLTERSDEEDGLQFLEASAGLELAIGGNLGASGSGTFGDTPTSGYAFTVRFTGAAQRSVYRGRQRFQKLVISGDVSERAPRNFFGNEVGQAFVEELRTIVRMKNDSRVDGLIIEVKNVEMGYGQLWELRRTLADFKAAGKPIVAVLQSSGYRDYYIASLADHVLMPPNITFNARGILAESMYYRALFDKVGVEADFVRIGDYKSAPESWTRDAPTEASEESLVAYLDLLWEVHLTEMGKSRGLKPERMVELVNAAPLTPEKAKMAKLIDRIVYVDEVEDVMKELYGDGVLIADQYDIARRDYDWARKPIIAVVYVDGSIVTGEGGANPLFGSLLTGSKTIDRVTKWAKENGRVKAVVLRVNSPGGSAVASDEMYRSLTKLSEEKPVIVSMGNAAASGGYYAAAAGDHIICNETTLTGSIGIFSGKFNVVGLFDLIGVNNVQYERGKNANLFRWSSAWTDNDRKVVYQQISYLYDLFLKQVAAGREKMKKEDVDKVGQGRIWSGRDAKAVGLCDETGSILDAIELARERGGLDADAEYDLVLAPQGDILSPVSPGLGISARSAVHSAPWAPDLADNATSAEVWRAYAPVRELLEPIAPALHLALTYEDGEALALTPFVLEFQ